jgi:PAS domain S-box-containing protein
MIAFRTGKEPPPTASVNGRLHGWIVALVLVIGLALTFWVSQQIRLNAVNTTSQNFRLAAQALQDVIAHEFDKQNKALQNIQALVASQSNLSEQDFQRYVGALRLDQEFPGLNALMFVQRQPGDYRVRLAGANPAVSREQELNWYTVPDLRHLLDSAGRTGIAALSAPTVKAENGDPTHAYLHVVPVYRGNTLPDDLAERDNHLLGWVVAEFSPHDWLSTYTQRLQPNLDFEVFDINDGEPGTLLYDRDEHLRGLSRQEIESNYFQKRLYSSTGALRLGARTWRLVTSSTPAFEAEHDSSGNIPTWILLSGSLTSALSALALWLVLTDRARAVRSVGRLTRDLEQLSMVARHTQNGAIITDANDRIVWVNDAFTTLTGYTAGEATGTHPGILLGSPVSDRQSVADINEAKAQRNGLTLDIINRHKSGRDHWVRLELRPMHNAQGEYLGHMELMVDMDEQRKNALAMATALRETDALMTALSRFAIVSETDAEGTIVRANAKFSEISGYTEEELFGQNHRILKTSVHPPAFWADFWHTISSGQPWRGEVCNRAKDGRLYWVESMVAPITNAEGRVERYVSIRFDITERKVQEETLRTQEELLRRMGKIAGVGYWLVDQQKRELYLSDEARQIFEVPAGLTPSVRDLQERYVPESQLVLSVAWDEALYQGQHFDLELALTTYAGKERWIRLAGEAEFAEGKPTRMMGAIQDITSRVESQRRIEENDRILRTAIDTLDEAFVLYDPQDRLVFCNEKYRDLYHLSRDLIVPGATFEQIVRDGAARGQYPLAVGREEEWVAERIAQHNSDRLEFEQQQLGGRWVRIVECKTADGYHVGFRIDITPLKKAVEDAEAASRSKSQFLANMSHEIRTPMNAILGMLQLLQNTRLSDQQTDYVDKTQGAAKSLLGILNDILDFSKVEAGKMQLDPEPVELDPLLRELGVILSSNLGKKRLELLFDIDPAIPRVVVADALRLKQILINLGGNAIKFTAQGEVLFKLRVMERTKDRVRIAFAVKDSGIGISPENQQKIFEGFSQAEASTTRRFGGTGLGLAISRRLVGLMGGELQLQSALGVGSTFHFELDLPVPEQEAETRGAPEPHAYKTVLLVDDNPVARGVHAKQLRTLGCLVDTAEDGPTALELTQSRLKKGQGYDAVFMDWELPDMDGWTTLDHLRKIIARAPKGTALPQTRYVMISAHGQDTLQLRPEQDTAMLDTFLVKPVTPEMLAEALTLDSVKKHKPQKTETDSPAVLPLKGMRVLLAEDNIINQQVARELLTRQGAEVRVAENGQLCLDALRLADPPFHVVLMDMQMPVMDGIQATQAIRQRMGLTDLPIIAMTANAMASDRDACLDAGMNDHIGKPFDLKRLVTMLRDWSGWNTDPNASVGPGNPPPPAPNTSTPPTAHAPVLDAASAIDRLGNDPDFYSKMLAAFSADAPDMLQELEQQWPNDLTKAAAVCHAIKGTAATVGALALAKVAEQAEAAAKAASKRGHGSAQHPTPPFPSGMAAEVARALEAAQAWLVGRVSSTVTAHTANTGHELQKNVIDDLRRLERLLGDCDMAAHEVHESLLTLGDRRPGADPHWRHLNGAMGHLNFEEALASTKALLAELTKQ